MADQTEIPQEIAQVRVQTAREDFLDGVVAQPLQHFTRKTLGLVRIGTRAGAADGPQAGLHFAGRVASLGALFALAVLACAVPRSRWLDRRELRESLAVFAICAAGMLLAAWPLLHQGHASYVAYGNPDAASNLAINDTFLHHGYGNRTYDFPPFWPRLQFAQAFGAGYIPVLLAVVQRIMDSWMDES